MAAAAAAAAAASASSPLPMDRFNVIKAAQDYVDKMVGDVSGMKVFLMDKETMMMVSIAYTQSALLKKDVFLVDLITTSTRERMPHLKAVVFIRPVTDSLEALAVELKNPKYSEYHVVFSNAVQDTQLRMLATADEHEVVQNVYEMFCDFFAVNRNLFSLNLPYTSVLHVDWEQPAFFRSVDGLMAVLLALKKRPVVRYSAGSNVTKRIAEELARRMEKRTDLFDFRRGDTTPVLLIMDRRDDPVTPLLHQWTYQAMVHELLGINNNRVSLKGGKDIRKELEDVVLSVEGDEFFSNNLTLNFGDLGSSVMALVEAYQERVHSTKRIESIADMKAFIEQYPEFRKVSGSVSKHVAVIGELARLVEERNLMDVSELEQELCCNADHSRDFKNIESLLRHERVTNSDALKLVLLYCLRYETSSSNAAPALYDMLARRGVPPEQLALLDGLLRYAGARVRSGDLFGAKSLLAEFSRHLQRGLKGVDNVLIQHQPYLTDVLKSLVAGKLPEKAFPVEGGQLGRDRPQEILVYFTGGVTFEESVAADRFMRENPGVTVVLGGSTIHNSQSFLADVSRYAMVAR